jgi:hypothetical protein
MGLTLTEHHSDAIADTREIAIGGEVKGGLSRGGGSRSPIFPPGLRDKAAERVSLSDDIPMQWFQHAQVWMPMCINLKLRTRERVVVEV